MNVLPSVCIFQETGEKNCCFDVGTMLCHVFSGYTYSIEYVRVTEA